MGNALKNEEVEESPKVDTDRSSEDASPTNPDKEIELTDNPIPPTAQLYRDAITGYKIGAPLPANFSNIPNPNPKSSEENLADLAAFTNRAIAEGLAFASILPDESPESKNEKTPADTQEIDSNSVTKTIQSPPPIFEASTEPTDQ